VSEPNEAPPVDPDRVHLAYRQARAQRRARIEHRRRRRWAGVRFWLTLLLLLVAAVAIAYGVWLELQHLLGD
jgi:anti-sigma-K factor RskA